MEGHRASPGSDEHTPRVAAAHVPSFSARPSSGASTPTLIGDVFFSDPGRAPLQLLEPPPITKTTTTTNSRAGAKLPSVSKRSSSSGGATAAAAGGASVPAPITIPAAAAHASALSSDDGLRHACHMARSNYWNISKNHIALDW
jgi:hypothetical protein